MRDYIVDEERKENLEKCGFSSGYYVRAFSKKDNKYISCDILALDSESLRKWLNKYSKEAIINLFLNIFGY